MKSIKFWLDNSLKKVRHPHFQLVLFVLVIILLVVASGAPTGTYPPY